MNFLRQGFRKLSSDLGFPGLTDRHERNNIGYHAASWVVRNQNRHNVDHRAVAKISAECSTLLNVSCCALLGEGGTTDTFSGSSLLASQNTRSMPVANLSS